MCEDLNHESYEGTQDTGQTQIVCITGITPVQDKKPSCVMTSATRSAFPGETIGQKTGQLKPGVKAKLAGGSAMAAALEPKPVKQESSSTAATPTLMSAALDQDSQRDVAFLLK